MTTSGLALVSGWTIPVMTAEENEAAIRAWEEHERFLARTRLSQWKRAAGIPERYMPAELDGRYPCGILRSWVEHPTDGLILVGGIGTGKTWWACAAMAAAMEAWNCSGRFVSSSAFVKSTIEDGWERFTVPRILVFDDLGKEKAGEFFTSAFFRLIDARTAANKKTIITTNYGPEALMGRFSVDGDKTTADALASRMRRFRTVRIDGKDLR